MADPKTHYDNLQVTCSASDVVIKGAFRALSQKHHPDKNPDNREQAERNMQIINEAFAVLSDPVRRHEYDDQLEKRALATKSAAEASANDATWMEMKREQALAAQYAQAAPQKRQNSTPEALRSNQTNPISNQLSNLIIKLDALFRSIGRLLQVSRQMLLVIWRLLPWLPLFWVIKAAWEPAYGGFIFAFMSAVAWMLLVRIFFPNSWVFVGTLIRHGWQRLVVAAK